MAGRLKRAAAVRSVALVPPDSHLVALTTQASFSFVINAAAVWIPLKCQRPAKLPIRIVS